MPCTPSPSPNTPVPAPVPAHPHLLRLFSAQHHPHYTFAYVLIDNASQFGYEVAVGAVPSPGPFVHKARENNATDEEQAGAARRVCARPAFVSVPGAPPHEPDERGVVLDQVRLRPPRGRLQSDSPPALRFRLGEGPLSNDTGTGTHTVTDALWMWIWVGRLAVLCLCLCTSLVFVGCCLRLCFCWSLPLPLRQLESPASAPTSASASGSRPGLSASTSASTSTSLPAPPVTVQSWEVGAVQLRVTLTLIFEVRVFLFFVLIFSVLVRFEILGFFWTSSFPARVVRHARFFCWVLGIFSSCPAHSHSNVSGAGSFEPLSRLSRHYCCCCYNPSLVAIFRSCVSSLLLPPLCCTYQAHSHLQAVVFPPFPLLSLFEQCVLTNSKLPVLSLFVFFLPSFIFIRRAWLWRQVPILFFLVSFRLSLSVSLMFLCAAAAARLSLYLLPFPLLLMRCPFSSLLIPSCPGVGVFLFSFHLSFSLLPALCPEIASEAISNFDSAVFGFCSNFLSPFDVFCLGCWMFRRSLFEFKSFDGF
ncbi:hypothetical protein GALMADRAFT_787331 [Galerina marginata CBS 339.88]|uniref:Transmembrane protein n=1 Tax=Galerina marginata (strain CBS 339.88) TaxID=685588 RepID=A0A067SKP0_GALM3|nr:hypothetical protein GALMADRAFT_787331 [Galerina marginata CBS 339.88]